MRLVSYNIQFGTGRDGLVDLERIAKEVDDADIIALQEVDRFWERSGYVDQVAFFKGRFSAYHAEYGAGVSIGIDQHDAGGNVVHQRRQFGNLTLSRYPILYCRHHLLPKYATTGPVSIQRSAIECVIDSPFGVLRIVNTHLTHLSAETRLPQIEKLLEIHQDAPLEGEPVCGNLSSSYWEQNPPLPQPPRNSIFMGDFNLEPDSEEYTSLTGPVSVHGGRMTNPELLQDAWVGAGHGETEGVSSDVHGRPAKLDYIFISPALAGSIKDCRIDDNATGSDHQPIWLELGGD